MSERIPVNVLTGFLGSGKTSLLNRLLRDPLFHNCAVLINEFGDIGIDHHLVDRIDGDMVLLQSGCICCTIRGDLATAIRDLYERRERGEIPAFGRLVIETTGLADPVPVLSTVMYDRVLQHHFRVGNVVATVDAVNGAANLGQYPECQKQVAVADRLVLTKLDISDAALLPDLQAQLAQVNPSAPCIALDPVRLDARAMLGADVFDRDSKSEEVAHWLQATRQRNYLAVGASLPSAADANVHRDIVAFALDLPEAVDWTVFSLWLSLLLHAHGAQVLRVKGLLQVEGADAPVVIHGVQQLVHPPSHLERWPSEDQQSRLVFIVRGLEPRRIQDSLRQYLHDYR
jgi:Ni2+-binding GTPase involved in maturation of urease and hydrogenase